MKKEIKKVAVLLAVVLLTSMLVSITATAATHTENIEIRSRSIILIDKSGSINDQIAVQDEILEKYNLASYDAVMYFDHRISADPDAVGGGDSYICEAIDKAADGGYTHITVVTDGEQWPADYSALGLYADKDFTIHLVEETECSKELLSELEETLDKSNSNLKVVKPDGTEEEILNGYQPEVYTIQFEVPEIPHEELSEDEDGKCYWWVALLLAVLLAALFDFIHELITRRRRKEEKKEEKEPTGGNSVTTAVAPAPKPIPTKAIVEIAQGAHVLADISGSMAELQDEISKACMDAQKGNEAVICFGDSISEYAADELQGIQPEGQTAGWEAMEAAAEKGWEEIVLISDLGFNGKAFDEKVFSKKFKKVTIVTPKKCYAPTLEEINKIADEVEVLPLQ